MDLAGLTLAVFEPLVGDRFTLDAGAEQHALVLESAAAAGERPGGRQPFGLIFRGPPAPVLPQAIYPLTHSRLGTIEIFIVPVGSGAAGAEYQAIFT